jgi:hypothetical protein
MIPALGHYDSWHDDDFQNRLIGMSINLSPIGYEGGLFQMRKRKSDDILAQIANTGFGDALIFRISGDLEHRVAGVEGTEPKTAFAGWFQPDLPEYLGDLLERAKKGQKSEMPDLKA